LTRKKEKCYHIIHNGDGGIHTISEHYTHSIFYTFMFPPDRYAAISGEGKACSRLN
jgi:hypothetical protein